MNREESKSQPWYAVKCLFSHPTRAKEGEGNLYEERVTLWNATSWEEAFKLAKEESKIYEEESECIFIEATDAFHLFDRELGVGTEVWSTMRSSHFDSDSYIKTYCVSGRERLTSSED